MIHAAYALPDGTPADGPDLASTTGWLSFTGHVLEHAEEYPEVAHLAEHGWNDRHDELDHELNHLLHASADPNITAVAAQVLAALRTMPDGATFYATDGEPGSEEDETDETQAAEEIAP